MKESKQLRSPQRLLTVWMIAALSLAGCAGEEHTPASEDNPPDLATQLIPADAGGTVYFNDRVSLQIPPDSLAEDTIISIEPVASAPVADADGFSATDLAFRFSPPGVRFSLDKPALLEIRYEPQALEARGLHPRTLQMYYYDERLQRYVNVASHVDENRRIITAQVEHFTIYVPMALGLVPGNNPPTAVLQDPVPNPIRADAPIYLRATARDFDAFGAVAGAQMCFRRLQPSPGAFECRYMDRETRTNVITWYGVVVESAFLTSADLGPGDDLEYYVEVIDNLGAISTSASRLVDVDRVYVPGTLAVDPDDLFMTAGSYRSFLVTAQDDLADWFNLLPEHESLTGDMGTILRKETNGITVLAETATIGNLQVGFAGESASATITVFNGELQRMTILDNNGRPFDGTFKLGEGHSYQFGAIGYDDWDNQILVNPTWSSDATLGLPIRSDGWLHALDGSDFGTVVASLGPITATQWVQVLVREWLPLGGQLDTEPANDAEQPAIAVNSDVPYVVWVENGRIVVKRWDGDDWAVVGASLEIDPAGAAQDPVSTFVGGTLHVAWSEVSGGHRQIYVKHWDGFAWVQDGDSLNVDVTASASAPSVGNDGASPYVAWQEAGRIFVKRWTGMTWAQDGGALNIDNSRTASQPSLAVAGGVPFVAWSEDDGTAEQIRVKQWTGSAWVAVGGSLNVDGTRAASNPSLAISDTAMYVVWSETDGSAQQVYGRTWDGSQWQQVGGSLNMDGGRDALGPSMGISGSTPYVAWYEADGVATNVHVKHWNGSAWLIDGGSLNIDPSMNAASSDLTINGVTPYVTWQETDGAADDAVYVRVLEVGLCGNGAVNLSDGEVCDDGNTVSGDGCSADCRSAEFCGNGYVDGALGESCDDGNTIDGDGCSAVCEEEGVSCGNGVVEAGNGEECDAAGESAICDIDCTFVVCGDSYVNLQAAEQCDNGGVDTVNCDGDCTAVICGDSYVNTVAESCDDGGVNTATCDQDCTLPECGDGIVNTTDGEICDDGNNTSGDGCRADCQVEECAGSLCAATDYGPWSGCDYSNVCDESATRSRSVTTYACVDFMCASPQVTTEVEACNRDTAGVTCDTSDVGTWSACGGFSGPCDETGTQSRARTDYMCSGGTCQGTASTDTQTCSIDTDGDSCGSSTYTAWSNCGAFSSTCDESGTQSRTRTDYTCTTGTCGGSNTVESQSCSRDTDGTVCSATTYGTWSACGGFSDTCDETGSRTRTQTDYSCTVGNCTGYDSTDTGTCSIDTDGVSCGAVSYGPWGACNTGSVCSETGTRSRTVNTPICGSGACFTSTSTETQPCTVPSTDGNSCGATVYGPWTACFVGPGGCQGLRSRSVTTYTCSGESCQGISTTESTSCYAPNGTSCEVLGCNGVCLAGSCDVSSPCDGQP